MKFLSAVEGRFWLRRDEPAAPSGSADTIGMIWESSDNQQATGDLGFGLSVFAGGPTARRAIDAPDKVAYYRELLEQVYPGYDAPGGFVNGQFVNWPETEWIWTGYSMPAPGQVTTVAPNFAAPFADRLYFAGEHACPAFVGFMEGALQSGFFTAVEIAKRTGLRLGSAPPA